MATITGTGIMTSLGRCGLLLLLGTLLAMPTTLMAQPGQGRPDGGMRDRDFDRERREAWERRRAEAREARERQEQEEPQQEPPAPQVTIRQMTDQEAAEMFDRAFGDRVRQAQASRNRQEQLQVAEHLLGGVRRMPETPKVQILAALKAIELSIMSSEGYEVAKQTKTLLGNLPGGNELAIVEKTADLFGRGYLAASVRDRLELVEHYFELLIQLGDLQLAANNADAAIAAYNRARPLLRDVGMTSDDLNVRLRAAVSQQRINQRMETLNRRLLQNLEDHAVAGELATLYVVERNDPAQAATYAAMSQDTQLNQMLNLVQTATWQLENEHLLTLADWYNTLSNDATDTGKRYTLGNAVSLYEIFLNNHRDQDAIRYRAQSSLEQARETLEKLSLDGWQQVQQVQYERGLQAYFFRDRVFQTLAARSVATESIDWWSRPHRDLPTSNYSCIYVGYIRIDEPGVYNFHVRSNDGHQLWINGRLISNDGSGRTTNWISGSIQLDAGYHPMELRHFKRHGLENLSMAWTRPDGRRENVPGSIFYHRPSRHR